MKRHDLENRQLLMEFVYGKLDNDLEWDERSFWAIQPNANGVYVVYLYSENRGIRYIYVGHGNIRRRINEHRKPESHVMVKVPHVRDRYKLCVAWSLVNERKTRKGIEVYLAQELRPKAGKLWHNNNPIRVNLPQFSLRW